MGGVPQFAVSKAREAYFRMRSQGQVPVGVLPGIIEASWGRCLGMGLADDHTRPEPQGTDRIKDACHKNQLLLDHALPIMETLYEQIIDSQSMVVLTNPDGLILHSVGDDEFLDRAGRVALKPGVDWSEDCRGTNAIGTALIEQRPVVVHGPQHFLSANHFLTCSASPILDPHGAVLGVLDVTGDHRSYSPHTLALVKVSVRLVENQMFAHAFPDGLVVHFHSRPEFLGTLAEGMMAFSPSGELLSVNRSGAVQFEMAPARLAGSTFESIFRQPIRSVLDHLLLHATEPLRLVSRCGRQLFARVTAGREMKTPLRVFTYPRAEESARPPKLREARESAETGCALAKLDTGDPQVHQVISKVRRVLGKDIPVLIHGETGAGKELLAKAIHDDGPRRDKAFVAVNCAAIPEGLIESELFGYEEGAFTGAKRKGGVGRILQADGGTLFLDEIGDMPLSLQARLLRVLQERVVTPLGSTKSVPVDITLVCATHRRLKDWVASGHFREDLYYRLNGLTVNLPPLRDRNDLDALVELIVSREAASGAVPEVSAEVMDMFRRHPWPGNIRQLSNLLRTALVMAGDDSVITMDHMPDDFLEEFESVREAGFPGKHADVRMTAAESAVAGDPSFGGEPAAARPHQPQSMAAVPGLGGGNGGNGATGGNGLGSSNGDLESTTLQLIQKTLEQHCGNVSAAARQLGISRNTLYRKLRQIWQI